MSRTGQSREVSLDRNLYDRLEADIHRLLVELLKSRGPVLEIGCGDCRHTDKLARAAGVRVVGIDINADVLPGEDRRAGVDCVEANAESLRAAVGKGFGGAVARFVIHELEHPKCVLREVFRAMKPGGVVALADPVKGSTAEQFYDEEYYTPGQLAGFLRWAGFSDVECTLLGNGNLAFVVGRKKRGKCAN